VKDHLHCNTNTSEIPIKDNPQSLARNWKETIFRKAFFNPPRYMKLLEIIPVKKPKKAVRRYMVNSVKAFWGKGLLYVRKAKPF